MAEKYIIELKHLTKTYEDNGFTAVDDFCEGRSKAKKSGVTAS